MNNQIEEVSQVWRLYVFFISQEIQMVFFFFQIRILCRCQKVISFNVNERAMNKRGINQVGCVIPRDKEGRQV